MGSVQTANSPRLTFAPDPTFTLAAHVEVDFAATYDAGVLIIFVDERHWAKLCFEYSPRGEPMVVSVVTNGVSDDCNSVPLGRRDIFLRVTRLGKAFAFHYSEDGLVWHMVRYFSLHEMAGLQDGVFFPVPNGCGVPCGLWGDSVCAHAGE